MFPVFSTLSQKVESRCTWTPFQSYFYVPVSISKVKVRRGSMSHFSKFPTTLYFHLKASKPRSCFSKDASYQSGGSTEMLLFSLLGCRERTFRLEGKKPEISGSDRKLLQKNFQFKCTYVHHSHREAFTSLKLSLAAKVNMDLLQPEPDPKLSMF